MRKSPRLSYLPSRLSMVPTLFANRLPPDAVVLHTTPPRDGKVSLGVEVNVLPSAVEAARRNGGVVIAQTNAEMPWTYGDALLDLDQVDVLVDADGPMPHAPAGSVDEDVGDDRESGGRAGQ